jgi:predicted RNA-binding Zn-ribbon protein involved in translation (DUF1610 family)
MSSDGMILFWFAIVRDFSIAVLLLVWAGSIAWVVRDAGERGVSRSAAFALAAVFPFAGAFVYALIRPGTRLAERRERELWLQLSLASRPERCQACLTPLALDFLVCPGCGETLRQRCDTCGAANELSWAVCPYCGARDGDQVWTEQEPARAAAEVTELDAAKRARRRAAAKAKTAR